MKIALVCQKFRTDYGGLERYTISLARELLKRGHEVHVLANRWEPHDHVIFHRARAIRLDSPVKNLSFALSARRIIQRESFDMVQSMERVWRQDIFRASDGINPVQVARRHASPLKRRLALLNPRNAVLRLLEYRIFRFGGARRILTNSFLVRRQITDHYGVRPEKISVLYNAVDTARFHPKQAAKWRETVRRQYGIGPADLLLLFVGNNYHRKGLATLLQALAPDRKQRNIALIAGKGDAGHFSRLSRSMGAGDRVVFAGQVTDTVPLYAAADLFVLPTEYDAFANVCLEAMACGLPVITTDNNGASEIIHPGVHGHVFPVGDADHLAHALDLCQEENARKKMGEAARALTKNFTMERYMERLLDLYAEVSQEKSEMTALRERHP